MENIKVLIVEDELIIAEDIKWHLLKLGYSITGIATSYLNAIKLLDSDKPDLAIVDIMLKGAKSGIDLGKYLHDELGIPFIYLSSHSDARTVEQAKGTYPNAYLLKPFRAESLYTSIEVAIANAATENIEKNKNLSCDNLVIKDCLFIKKSHLYFKTKINDILFIKAEGNYLELNLNNSKKYLIRSTIKTFTQHLSPFNFFQCHKSYIINLEFVDIVSYTFVKIREYEIPLSKSKKDQLLSVMRSFS